MIVTELETYQDCISYASSKLSRHNRTLAGLNATYQTAYQRALTGIGACYKTYPSKYSIVRLRSCVKTMNRKYFSAANNTQYSLFPSPSMNSFQDTVVKCASNAASGVAAKGLQFLDTLVNCASLSKTIDPTVYAEELVSRFPI